MDRTSNGLMRVSPTNFILLLIVAGSISLYAYPNMLLKKLIIRPAQKLFTQQILNEKDIMNLNELKNYQRYKGVVDIQTWESKNGAKINFVAAHELPIIDIKIDFRAGSAYDGNKYGLSQLTLSVLESGTVKLDAQQLAEEFENRAVNFGAAGDIDQANFRVRMRATPELQNEVSELLNQILTQPRFDSNDLNREKMNTLSHLKDLEQDPASVGIIDFKKLLYGNHPYAHQASGTEETVTAINIEDIKQFHRKYFVAKNCQITIVGDLTLDAANKLVENILTNLPSGELAEITVAVAPLAKNIEKNIDFPSTQAHLYYGQVGTASNNEDNYALAVGNFVLGGGGFSSRLMQQIRVDNGLAYSVSSQFSKNMRPGLFLINLQTKQDQVAQALALSKQVLQNFIDKGPTDKELQLAKSYLTGSFVLSIKSNNNILNIISRMQFYGLPIDYLDQYQNKIENITKENVMQTFKKYIDPSKMLTVVVGANKT